jgi:hypothetical protein
MCRRSFWDERAAQPKPRAPAPPAEAPAAAPPRPAAPRPAPAKSPASAYSDAWTEPILIAAFILVLTGLGLGKAEGTALLWLGLIPALFVTALSGFRVPKTKPKTPLEKLRRGLTIFASGVAVMIIAAAAIAIALAAACAAIIGMLSMGNH